MLMREPQVCLGPTYAQGQYQFFVSGSAFATPANVYQDAALTSPFPNIGTVGADAFGRFPPIYLDGSITYGVILTNAAGAQQYAIDPYTPPLSTNGLSTNVAFGPQIAVTGEVILAAPAAGGTQVTLALAANVAGAAALQISSTLAGQSALIINNSVTTGAQTATFTATNKPGTATSSPAGWLPITCDGVQYYTPIWHGNNFTPYVANPAAVGQTINAGYILFGGNGASTATGGTAVPSSWFSPNTNNIGASYFINITKTSGNSGTSFSSAQGSWVNIGAGGLTIGTLGTINTILKGTYQLSTSVTGSPVVASGTIQLSTNATATGINDSVAYSGAANLILAGNGTSTLNGVAGANWFLPTTASKGSLYWLNITRTGGTSGVTFNNALGAFTNISNGGITIGLTGTGARNATGTYQISSNAGGTLIVGSGTISLTASGVNNTNWSGSAPLALAGNGTATLAGVAQTNWFSPTTSNVGSLYWINITRTGGTTGVNFSNGQGSWTNITNSGFSTDLTGTSGIVGAATVSGSYQLSSASGGSPVLGSGTITINRSGFTVIHIYTSATTGTETIPTGTTTVQMEVWGDGGGGAAGTGSGCTINNGTGAGGGALVRSSYAASALGGVGKTLTWSIGAGGAGGNPGPGTNGAGSFIHAGTATGFTAMNANGGGGGNNATGGAGGTGTGGNVANTTGNSTVARAQNGAVGLTGGISGDGSPYGAGGSGGGLGSGSPGSQGNKGAVVFKYS